MILRSSLALLGLCLVTATAWAQALAAPYNTKYTLNNLGPAPGVPSPYGGVCFLDNNTLLLGGLANVMGAQIFAVPVVRGAGNHITGFAGTSSVYKNADFIEAGLVFGPGGDLFVTTYPINKLYQYLPSAGLNPSTTIDLTPLGVASSTGTCVFVPNGFGIANPGGFRLTSFTSSDFYTAGLTPDLVVPGTWDVVNVQQQVNTGGGPEGIIYVPPGSPIFNPANRYVVMCEWSANQVAAYQLDANGYPMPATQSLFIPTITGPEGAFLDPLTNDMVFSTFSGTDQVIIIQGFQSPGGGGSGSSSGEGSFAGVDPPPDPSVGEGSFGFGGMVPLGGPGSGSMVVAAPAGAPSQPALAGPFVGTPGGSGLTNPTPGFASSPSAGTCMHVFNASFLNANAAAGSSAGKGPAAGDLLSWAILAGLGLALGLGLAKINLTPAA